MPDDLFDGGPPLRLQRSIGLIKPGDRQIRKRVFISILIGWVPILPIVLLAVPFDTLLHEIRKLLI